MLKKFIRPSDCAKCRLCCNFHRSSVWESPFIPEDQAERLSEEGITMEQRERGGWSFVFHFDGDEAANCPKLDVETGCSLPEGEKPFECRVWPLRMMEEDGGLLIGRYRHCPALAGGVAGQLDQFARNELLPVLLAFAGKHPESIRRRSPEYEIIWRGTFRKSANGSDS